jgi:RNA polymerase sigma factor (sigma-70 family)
MMTRMARIDETIRQSTPGDPLLYEALMVDYYNFIHRLTYSILGDACEADDAAQESFIKAVAHLRDYQFGTNIKSWLAKIAINICRDKLRTLKARKRLHDVLKLLSWQTTQGSPTPEETVIRDERKKIIQSEIERLDEKHRLPVLLRYGQGMSIAEIAETLDINEGTVHSRLHYAHLKLRDRLNGMKREQDCLAKEDFE